MYEADEWEVERDDVTLLDEIGKGAFGVVRKGILKKADGEIKVAVKVNCDTCITNQTLQLLLLTNHHQAVV